MTTVASASAPVLHVLEQLTAVKRNGSGWIARCPAHEDHTPSLSVSEGKDGRAVLHCHAGCEPSRVVAAIGMTLGELFPPRESNGHGAIVPPTPTRDRPALTASYDYTDADGRLLFQVCRMHPKDFRQRRPDPTNPGEWIWKLGDLEPVLYRLPEVIEAGALGRTIYLVEGEKDADRLRSLGLTTTTNPMGAGKWRDAYSASLAGASVVILPDNDEPGRKHAEYVSLCLTGIAQSVTVLSLSGLPPKGDVSDWLDAGHTREELEALAAAVDSQPRNYYTLREVLDDPALMRPPVFVVPRLVAERRSTMLVGHEKDGKTTVAAYVAAAVSTGTAAFGQSCRAGTVLIIGLEEFIGDMAQRLQRFGADPDRTHLVIALRGTTVQERLADIGSYIERLRPALVEVDTLLAFAGGFVESTNADAEMQPVVQGLTNLAHASGAGLLIIHHARRSDGAFRGSGTIAGSVDIVATMTTPDDSEDASTVREFRVVGRIPTEHFRVQYLGSSFELVADESAELAARVRDHIVLRPGCSNNELRTHVGGRAGKIDEAVNWLVERGAIIDQRDGNKHSYFIADGDLHLTSNGAPSHSSRSGTTPEPQHHSGTRPTRTTAGRGAADLWDDPKHSPGLVDPACPGNTPLGGVPGVGPAPTQPSVQA